MKCPDCGFVEKERFYQAATGDKQETELFSLICRRFPTPVSKRPNDMCGEFQKRKEENENTATDN